MQGEHHRRCQSSRRITGPKALEQGITEVVFDRSDTGSTAGWRAAEAAREGGLKF